MSAGKECVNTHDGVFTFQKEENLVAKTLKGKGRRRVKIQCVVFMDAAAAVLSVVDRSFVLSLPIVILTFQSFSFRVIQSRYFG